MDGTAPVQDLLERVSKTFRTACPRVTGLDVHDHRNTHIKEIRKRTRPMNSIANIEAAEKIVYLFSTAYNEVWSKRVIRGFGDAQTGAALAKMYAERYGTS